MKTRDIVYIALFAAIMAALGLFPKIPVPIIPTPITAQSMGVMLAGSILGAKRGALAIALFVLLVAVGLPILAGGRGGLAMITTSASAGYIYGWIFGAFVVGYFTEMFWDNYNIFKGILANVLGGIVGVYLIGVPWLAAYTDMSLLAALTSNFAFIPGDLIKAIVAAAIAVAVKMNYPLIRK